MSLAAGTAAVMPRDIKEEFGRNLTAARDAARQRENARLSFDTLAAEMVGTFGPKYVPTGQAIADWHNGKVSPEGIRLEWIEWLAGRYGVTLSSLSPVFAERLGPARDLLSRSRCVRPVTIIPGQTELPLWLDRPSLSVVRSD